MARAKLTFDERVLIETSLDEGVTKADICIELGISTYQLQQELRLGWLNEKRKYSAEKAQFSLR